MKAKHAGQTFCPIRGIRSEQVGDHIKVFNQPCSTNCSWWVWWPNSEEDENGERDGACVVHDIAGAIETMGG